MTLLMATKAEIDLRPADDVRPGAPDYMSVMAIFDGKRWVGLSREFNIASEGDSAFEAIISTRNAVAEAVAVAAEHGISPGEAVSDKDLREFLNQHEGPEPVQSQIFAIA